MVVQKLKTLGLPDVDSSMGSMAGANSHQLSHRGP